MSVKNLPYVANPGTLKNMLERMRDSILPERFTGDFVETKLQMKGGTAKSIIPFIKKMGLVTSDGIPTDLYKEYRNKARSKIVIGKAIKIVYHDVFDQNEYAYDLSDNELIGLVVQITGGDEKSSALKLTLATFKTLKDNADFNDFSEPEVEIVKEKPESFRVNDTNLPQLHYTIPSKGVTEESINLSYTINLNLPSTTNIEVFNAIFKSLKEHLISQ